jgi:hypothetical protein
LLESDRHDSHSTELPHPSVAERSVAVELSADAVGAEIEAAAVHAAARRQELADIASQNAAEHTSAAADENEWHRQQQAARDTDPASEAGNSLDEGTP